MRGSLLLFGMRCNGTLFTMRCSKYHSVVSSVVTSFLYDNMIAVFRVEQHMTGIIQERIREK